MSTKVLFPRFETETVHAEVHERELVPVAELRPWIDDEQVELLTNPATDTHLSDQPDRYSSNPDWFGVYCSSVEVMPLDQQFESSSSRGSKVFRSRLLHHSYLRDPQAVPSRADEIILEQRDTRTRNGFKEMMALLIPESSRPLGQRLVVATRCGQWIEPKFEKRNRKRQFYLKVLSELAVRNSQASEAIQVAV